MSSPSALYVHVPFCVRKCRYCDFFSVPVGRQPVERYLDCLGREFDAAGAGSSFDTIYVGGGTPTALTEQQLESLLAVLARRVDIDAVTEFTIEANPGTVSLAKLRLLRSGGVNRLSIGVQSFDPQLLGLLGRAHSPADASEAARLAHQAGFDNLSIDLIFGIPGQTALAWAGELESAFALGIAHLSAYGLTYEEGTPLHDDLSAGRLDPAPPELEREMVLHTIRRTRTAGLEHYEISNYARPGLKCRHNLTYWANESYLGLGAGAVSYLDGERRRNVEQVALYVDLIEASGRAGESSETLAPEPRARESAVLALRTRKGLYRAEFLHRTGFEIDALFRKPIADFVRQGVLTDDGSRIALTDEGVLVADEVSACVV